MTSFSLEKSPWKLTMRATRGSWAVRSRMSSMCLRRVGDLGLEVADDLAEEAGDEHLAHRGIDDLVAGTGHAGHVGGTDDGLGGVFEPGVDLLALVGPVAAGEGVDAGLKHVLDGLDLQALAVRQVFALSHHKINAVLAAELRQYLLDGLAARATHNVADVEDFHGYIMPQ
jgi:hypothetical protein